VLPDPSQHLFFVGYSDPNSPAGIIRKARHGDNVQLTVKGDSIPFNCDRQEFIFSAHARREDLLSYAIKVRPKTILLVHGDDPAVEWFGKKLSEALPHTRILTPPPGVPIDL
jgi:Cft2 family RNA processing exonuclease